MRFARLVVLALLAAGCVTPGADVDPGTVGAAPVSFAHLAAADAAETIDGASTRTFVFRGTTPLPGPNAPGGMTGGFEVDGSVGFVELNVTEGMGATTFAVDLLDDEGRAQCTASSFNAQIFRAQTPACTVPVVASDKAEWGFLVSNNGGAPNVPLEVQVTLHPASHIAWGDIMAGVDPEISFRVSDTGVDAGEDNIGVLGDGTIFAQKSTTTLRSTDDGLTWEEVGPPTTSMFTLDPMLYVDQPRGIVYVDQLYVACSILAWSKDAGATWATNPAACGAPSNDHQKIGSGPGILPGVPIVYYSYSNIPAGNIFVSRSIDGGLTFTTAMVTRPEEYPTCNDGHVFADEFGNVFVPMYLAQTGMIVGVSHDQGLTWKVVQASTQESACSDPDPGLWTDTDGTVYLAYHRSDGIYYVFSTDHGDTWSEPVKVSPPTLASFVHVDAVAGGPGRLAIAYRATPDTSKGPDLADGWARWRMYVTFVENATSAAPTIRTGLVGAPEAIDQRGSMCNQGIACGGNDRNLLDFIDVAVGPDGRVYVAYSDGCEGDVTECAQPADSRSALGIVAIQESGPRLFEDRAPWAT